MEKQLLEILTLNNDLDKLYFYHNTYGISENGLTFNYVFMKWLKYFIPFQTSKQIINFFKYMYDYKDENQKNNFEKRLTKHLFNETNLQGLVRIKLHYIGNIYYLNGEISFYFELNNYLNLKNNWIKIDTDFLKQIIINNFYKYNEARLY